MKAERGDPPPAPDGRSAGVALLPYNVVVFLGYLAVGIPLPVLSIQVHGHLGFGTVIVGIVVGLQSMATLLSRQYAGRMCDARGSKATALLGLAFAMAASLVSVASCLPSLVPGLSLAVLVGARVVLGLGESFLITGLASWALARAGTQHAGKVMAWEGMAMYGALAVGAPFGEWVDRLGGFASVGAVAAVPPIIGAVIAWFLPRAHRVAGVRMSFYRVLRAIWPPGLALALGSAGYGTLAAFLPLDFQASGWSDPGFALAAFAAGYILVRIFLADLPDRLGGITVALVCLSVEAAGQVFIWGAGSRGMAIAGAAITGLGYSLVFPALGVEAVRRVTPENQSLALAAYLACFDLGLGAAGPAAGLVASQFGIRSAFLAAAAAALASLVLTGSLRRAPLRLRRVPPKPR